MTKRLKIPKRIAGVKLPRKVRKKARRAIKASASPVVREIAAAAIGAVAGGGTRGREAGARVRVQIGAGRVAEAFRTAALDGLRCFLEGLDERFREMDDAEPRPRAKRRRP